jgi:glycosyltransferase involved in cell wall biosynthesis
MTDKLVIAVPAYNAAQTIGPTFGRIPDDIVRRTRQYIVVNDGSTDATIQEVERIQQRFRDVTLINHSENRGYSGACKTGLQAALDAGADLVVWLHSDGQYAPELIAQLLAPLERGEADIVQGSRMKAGGAMAGGMPLYKFLANKALTCLENIAFGMNLAEYHSGYMLYNRRVLSQVPFHTFRERTFTFDQEMMVAAHVRGFRVKDVAIFTRYAEETSHLKPIPYGIDVLTLIGRYWLGEFGAPRRRP